MSAGFTPGPWAQTDIRVQGRLAIMSVDGAVAYAAKGDGEVEDAILIAAAPELYEVAVDLCNSWDCPETRAEQELFRIVKAARAALAKARGEPA